jgi:hypothetical protein
MQEASVPIESGCELTTAHRELLRRPAALLLVAHRKNALRAFFCLLPPPIPARIPAPT